MIWKMAWRNLLRNRRRTIITLVSIAFGFVLSVTFTTLSDGSYGHMIDLAAHMGSGHVTVEPARYRIHPGTDLVVSGSDELAQRLRRRPGATKATIRVTGQAMIASANGSLGAAFLAIDPAQEKDSFFLLRHIKEGSLFAATDEGKILIGAKMAKALDVNLGKKLVLTTTDRNGEVVSGLLRVGGIFRTRADEMDKHLVVLPIDAMRKLLGYAPDEATQIALLLSDRRAAERTAKLLAPLVEPNGATAVSWARVMPDVSGAIAMDQVGNYFLQVFIFLLIGAGILNTVLMSVLERKREFGVMVAVGLSPARLWRLVMTETFCLAMAGLAVGAILSLPLYVYFHAIGLDMSSWMKEDMVVGGLIWEPIMKAELYWDHMALIFGGVFLLIMLLGVYPAYVTTRIQPVETLKSL
ncbi:MAG: ABC transporter permease [Myxococcales bacterium]|nr:MAG: ABC transporter permease [Myxococcales bacterium]